MGDNKNLKPTIEPNGSSSSTGNQKSSLSMSQRVAAFADNPPKYKPNEIYGRFINGKNLETDEKMKQNNRFYCLFCVIDGSKTFSINQLFIDKYQNYLTTPKQTIDNGCVKWNCDFEFPVETEKDYLTILVFRDKTKLGCFNIPCWDIPISKGYTTTLTLVSKGKKQNTSKSKPSTINLEVYAKKFEPFQLPSDPKSRNNFIHGYIKARDKIIKNLVLLDKPEDSAVPAGTVDNSESPITDRAITQFTPTSSPASSRTKITIKGHGLGTNQNDIKSIHICNLDVTSTLEHLNPTNLKVTTSFWKESVGKIKIVFNDGSEVESKENFEFTASKGDDITKLHGIPASQSDNYCEFVRRTPSSPLPTIEKEQKPFNDYEAVQYTGNIDFQKYQRSYERGTAEEIRSHFKELIQLCKGQQEELHRYMERAQWLEATMFTDAPHLLSKHKELKIKRNIDTLKTQDNDSKV